MKKYILVATLLFLIPLSVHAEESDISIALGKFFNHKIQSLLFRQTPDIVIFQSDVRDSGMTYIPNPMEGLRPIGPLSLINIPARALMNLSNFVMKEVSK